MLKAMKLKPSLHAKNTGALFKKFGVPTAARTEILKHGDVYKACIKYKSYCEFFTSPEMRLEAFKTSSIFTTRSRRSIDNHIRDFLFRFTEKRRLHVMQFMHVYDMLLFYRKISEVKPEYLDTIEWSRERSVQAIHDDLANLAQKIDAEKLQIPISYLPETIQKFDHIKSVDDYTIQLARTGEDLVRWGQQLEHCIGGYVDEAHIGAKEETDIFFAVFGKDKETPLWTGWFKKNQHSKQWWSHQFYGYRNDWSISHDDKIRRDLMKDSILGLIRHAEKLFGSSDN